MPPTTPATAQDTLQESRLDTANQHPDNTDLLPLEGVSDTLLVTDISKVMNPERLASLLAQADAFCMVNSESLDDF